MTKKLTVQDIIFTLEQYWADQGCMLMQAYDNEKGAGSMSPYTSLRVIGPEPWNVALNLHGGLLMVVMVKTQIGFTNTTNSRY